MFRRHRVIRTSESNALTIAPALARMLRRVTSPPRKRVALARPQPDTDVDPRVADDLLATVAGMLAATTCDHRWSFAEHCYPTIDSGIPWLSGSHDNSHPPNPRRTPPGQASTKTTRQGPYRVTSRATKRLDRPHRNPWATRTIPHLGADRPHSGVELNAIEAIHEIAVQKRTTDPAHAANAGLLPDETQPRGLCQRERPMEMRSSSGNHCIGLGQIQPARLCRISAVLDKHLSGTGSASALIHALPDNLVKPLCHVAASL